MPVKSYKTCKCHAGVRKAQSISVKLSVKLPKLAVGSFVGLSRVLYQSLSDVCLDDDPPRIPWMIILTMSSKPAIYIKVP